MNIIEAIKIDGNDYNDDIDDGDGDDTDDDDDDEWRRMKMVEAIKSWNKPAGGWGVVLQSNQSNFKFRWQHQKWWWWQSMLNSHDDDDDDDDDDDEKKNCWQKRRNINIWTSWGVPDWNVSEAETIRSQGENPKWGGNIAKVENCTEIIWGVFDLWPWVMIMIMALSEYGHCHCQDYTDEGPKNGHGHDGYGIKYGMTWLWENKGGTLMHFRIQMSLKAVYLAHCTRCTSGLINLFIFL